MPLENSTAPVIDQEPVKHYVPSEHLHGVVRDLESYQYGIESQERLRERREKQDAQIELHSPDVALDVEKLEKIAPETPNSEELRADEYHTIIEQMSHDQKVQDCANLSVSVHFGLRDSYILAA